MSTDNPTRSDDVSSDPDETLTLEAVPAEPIAAESDGAEPDAAEPLAADPEDAAPEAADPEAAEPIAAEPEPAEPIAAEPEPAEPLAAEPLAAEPLAAEPDATEALAVEPVADEPEPAEPLSAEPIAAEVLTAEALAARALAAEPAFPDLAASDPIFPEVAADEPATADPRALDPEAAEPAFPDLAASDPIFPDDEPGIPAPVLGEGTTPVDSTRAPAHARESASAAPQEPGSYEPTDIINWDEPETVTRRSIFADIATDAGSTPFEPDTAAEAAEPAGTAPVGVVEAAAATPGADTEQVTGTGAEGAVSVAPPRGRHVREPSPRTEDDILLEGSSVVGRLAPRTASHWAGVLLAVVLLPLAWFFLHDSAAQALTAVDTHRFALSGTALIELAVGAGALALAMWAARRSSLGTIVVGVLTLLVGLPALTVPSLMNQLLTPTLDRLARQSSLGEDLASYVWSDAVTGRFLWLGLLLIMVGVVSHSARRAGRREQAVVDRVRTALD